MTSTGTTELRVNLFSAITTVAASGLLLRLDQGNIPFAWWIAAAVAAMFVLGELVPIDLELHRETFTIPFTAIPFVVGLIYLPPIVLVITRIVATVIALGVIRRLPLVKLVSNLSGQLLAVAIATTLISMVDRAELLGPQMWSVIIIAVIAADLVDSLALATAISLYQGSFERSLPRSMWLGVVSTVADVAVAVVVVTLLSEHKPVALLMIAIAGFLMALSRSHSRMSSRYRNYELLYGFTQSLGEAIFAGDVLTNVVTESAEILHAEQSWLIEVGPDGTWRIELSNNHIERRPAEPVDHWIVEAVGPRLGGILLSGGEPLPDDGTVLPRDTLIARLLQDGDTRFLLCVADRRGSGRKFDDSDVAMIETLANQAGITLQNARLLDRLREESGVNEYLATHDSLTGLANRARFHQMVGRSLGDDDCAAVLLIDLDRFKEVNDTLGHHYGDLLLIEVGKRLADALGGTHHLHGQQDNNFGSRLAEILGGDHHLSRLGGDEFAVMLSRRHLGSMSPATMASQIRSTLERPFELSQVEVDVGASIGISTPESPSDNVAMLLRMADVAMYSAKERRIGVVQYEPGLDHHTQQQLAMVPRFRAALEHGDLRLEYQPKIDLNTQVVTGVEALVRWPVPGRGFIPPDEFIPIAEHTGLIHSLTAFVLGEAIQQCSRWQAEGRQLNVAVNLSPRNLLEPGLVKEIAELLTRHEIRRWSLRVEVTESTIMTDPELAIDVLTQLREMGVGISIDDFGTGYSSLAYLTRLPADELKIDRSFVLARDNDPASDTVIRAVIDLAANLGLQVVAEGVETQKDADDLRAMGCTTAQGYHFGRSMRPDVFATWLNDFERSRSTGTSGAIEPTAFV